MLDISLSKKSIYIIILEIVFKLLNQILHIITIITTEDLLPNNRLPISEALHKYIYIANC